MNLSALTGKVRIGLFIVLSNDGQVLPNFLICILQGEAFTSVSRVKEEWTPL